MRESKNAGKDLSGIDGVDSWIGESSEKKLSKMGNEGDCVNSLCQARAHHLCC